MLTARCFAAYPELENGLHPGCWLKLGMMLIAMPMRRACKPWLVPRPSCLRVGSIPNRIGAMLVANRYAMRCSSSRGRVLKEKAGPETTTDVSERRAKAIQLPCVLWLMSGLGFSLLCALAIAATTQPLVRRLNVNMLPELHENEHRKNN